MNVRTRIVTTMLSAAAVTGAVLVAVANPAAAATPPWEPDTTNQLGQIHFYNAAGAEVTSGTINDDPFAKYAVATSDDPQTSNTLATLYAYTPVNGVLPINWTGEQLSGTTTFPVPAGSGVPAVVSGAGAHRPVVTLNDGAHGNINLAGYIADVPNNDTTTAYAGLYELRIRTAGNDPKFWAADIQVTGSTWTVVYPATAGKDNSSASINGKTSINYGGSTTLSTTLTDTTANSPIGGASVALQRKSGSNWVTVATMNTASTGKASKSVAPTTKTTYRWSYAGDATHNAATSPTRTVTVAQVVSAQTTKTTVAHNVAFKIYGTVKPASAGQTVTLQRQAGTHWNNIGTATIKNQKLPNGTTTVGFIFTTKQGSAGTYKYRVSKGATVTLAAGTSSVLTVHVT